MSKERPSVATPKKLEEAAVTALVFGATKVPVVVATQVPHFYYVNFLSGNLSRGFMDVTRDVVSRNNGGGVVGMARTLNAGLTAGLSRNIFKASGVGAGLKLVPEAIHSTIPSEWRESAPNSTLVLENTASAFGIAVGEQAFLPFDAWKTRKQTSKDPRLNLLTFVRESYNNGGVRGVFEKFTAGALPSFVKSLVSKTVFLNANEGANALLRMHYGVENRENAPEYAQYGASGAVGLVTALAGLPPEYKKVQMQKEGANKEAEMLAVVRGGSKRAIVWAMVAKTIVAGVGYFVDSLALEAVKKHFRSRDVSPVAGKETPTKVFDATLSLNVKNAGEEVTPDGFFHAPETSKNAAADEAKSSWLKTVSEKNSDVNKHTRAV